jgi:hypothetical protein
MKIKMMLGGILTLCSAQTGAFDLGSALDIINSAGKTLNSKTYEEGTYNKRNPQSSPNSSQGSYSQSHLTRVKKTSSECDKTIFSDSSGKPNETPEHKQARFDCLVQSSQAYDRPHREKRRESARKRGNTPEKHRKDLIIMGLDPKKEIDSYDLTPEELRKMDKCYSERMDWKSTDRMNFCGYTYSQ